MLSQKLKRCAIMCKEIQIGFNIAKGVGLLMISYKKELYTDIRSHLSRLALFVSLLLVVALASLFLFIEKYQISADTEVITTYYQQIEKNAFGVLKQLNKKVIPNYLAQKSSERQLYAEYYDVSKDYSAFSDLLVLNNKGDISFVTGDIKRHLSPAYLSMMVESSQTNDFMKIQRGLLGKTFLLFFSKIPKTDDYSILVLSDNVFNLVPLQYGTHFAITDKYDNVFAKNSSNFIEGDLEKINRDVLSKPIFLENNHLYLSKQQAFSDKIMIYTNLMTFPITSFFWFCLFLMLLLLFLLTLQSEKLAQTIAKKNNKHIKKLVGETSLVTEGKQSKIEIETNVEFQFLIDSINEMVGEKENLLTQQLFLERQNASFEKKVLESQFNPHFIYNTLETIRVTSHFDPGIADKLILSLNRVLRYSIDYTTKETTLEDDLNIIKDFLEVNNIRFDKFSYMIEVEDDLLQTVVPKLFLLPVVENALKYGMATRTDLKIIIKCYKGESGLYFDIIDNGPGFEPSRIEEIYHAFDSYSHHGLINSYRRLKMTYPFSDLIIKNRESEGAIVRFNIWEETNEDEVINC